MHRATTHASFSRPTTVRFPKGGSEYIINGFYILHDLVQSIKRCLILSYVLGWSLEDQIMNIFFLSLDPNECARLYCDQHVVKILLEIVQMLYTAWHLSGFASRIAEEAPFNKSGTQRGYRPSHA